MIKETFSGIRAGLIYISSFTLLTGFVYPIIITGCAQLFFPWQANGSLIEQNGTIIGSALIGQYFTDPKYFWGRPSATTPFPYNSESSSGSNMGPSNPRFLTIVSNRISAVKQFHPDTEELIPVDLVTASGSGLDPDISPLSAYYQVPRIAKARNISEEEIQELINNLIKKRPFFILGEPRVHILQLNIALDSLGTTP